MRMTARSQKDFVPALRDLMAASDLSFRKLSGLTAPHRGGQPISLGVFTAWMRGEKRPTPDAMAVVARAASVEPEYFREYREHVAAERARELAGKIGLDEVLQALERLDPPKKPRKR